VVVPESQETVDVLGSKKEKHRLRISYWPFFMEAARLHKSLISGLGLTERYPKRGTR